jgi:Reverse transcriptase (RNA-dependent DNA polymerase)
VRLIKILTDMGFAPEIVLWCCSFLKDWTVCLHFNAKILDPFDLAVGTPQGLPISPVLLIIYTAPLLYKMQEWTNLSLGMYIDDSAIFVYSNHWEDIESAMRVGYSACAEWLERAGLSIEPNKTELIFFRK